jgi:uncharacterized RDD family membrane protein YckC
MPYFLHIAGTRKGPVEISDIKRMVENGALTILDQVWDEAGKKWTVIRDFPAIAKLFDKGELDDEFIINVGGKTGGPFPLKMIVREIENGRFLSNHFVWDEAKSRWIEARRHPVFENYFAKAATSDKTYHVAKSGVRIGPVPFSEVVRLIKTGELTPEDHVWDYTEKRWVPLRETAEFAAIFPVPAEPAVPVEPAPPIPESPAPVPETTPPAPVEPVPPAPPSAGPPVTAAETPIGTVPTGVSAVTSAPGDLIEIPAGPGRAPPKEEATPTVAPVREKDVEPRPTERPGAERVREKAEPTVIEQEEVKAFEPTRPSPVKRLVAQIIDVGFISVFFLAVLIVMALAGMNPFAPSPEQETYRATAFIIFGVIALVYLLFRDGFGGASMGKRVMGLKVVQGSDARAANPFHSFVRNLFLLIPILNIAEFFMVITDTEGRRLGDKTIGCALMYSTEAEYIRDYGLEAVY